MNYMSMLTLSNQEVGKYSSIVGVVFDPIHDIAFAPNMGRYDYAKSSLPLTGHSTH